MRKKRKLAVNNDTNSYDFLFRLYHIRIFPRLVDGVFFTRKEPIHWSVLIWESGMRGCILRFQVGCSLKCRFRWLWVAYFNLWPQPIDPLKCCQPSVPD